MPLPSTTAYNAFAQYYYTKTELNAGQLDNLYFGEDEFLSTSAGAGDAGKPVKLDSSGHIDATMINDGDISHLSISDIGSNTHAQIDTHIAATTAHGATGAVVGTTNTQTLTNKTLTTPTISSTGFTNAQHAHTGASSGGQLDHGNALTGLSDDDHTQYALLAGRGGGQNLYGGTASGDDLLLESTSNSTKGTVALNPNGGNVSIGTNNGTSKLYIYGTQASASAGPHVHVVTTEDSYPLLHIMGQQHDNVAISWDAYFDSGGFKAGDATGTQWYKAADNFKLRYFNSATPGAAPSWSDAITLTLGTGVTTIASLEATAATVGGVAVVTTTGTQTLTNKTLTTPVISTISNSGTITLPTGTRTLVARDTTDTLTNKTLTSPTINSPTIATPTITTSATVPLIHGGTSANDNITIHGTSHATKTTSYVLLQPSGGNVGVGTTSPDYLFEAETNSHTLAFAPDYTGGGQNYILSTNTGSLEDMVLFGSRIIVGANAVNISTSQSPTSSGTGNAGDIAWDSNYLYLCYASNSWGRVAITKSY